MYLLSHGGPYTRCSGSSLSRKTPACKECRSANESPFLPKKGASSATLSLRRDYSEPLMALGGVGLHAVRGADLKLLFWRLQLDQKVLARVCPIFCRGLQCQTLQWSTMPRGRRAMSRKNAPCMTWLHVSRAWRPERLENCSIR